ncbi:hypothetical protein MNB_SM-7-382 [hydrothermal vent metagenome]|uniref:Uncharacterized protein n=1 Tax=hydrothermal vent metagenome TaxID=652676 RepID=A0A1W1BS65_9ZZZZ
MSKKRNDLIKADVLWRSFGYASKKIFHNLTFFSTSHIFV